MKRFALTIALVVAALASGFAWVKQRALTQANFRIAQLEREIRVTKVESRTPAAAPTIAPALAPSHAPTSPLASTLASASGVTNGESSSTSPTMPSLTEWRINEELETIEKFVSLNDEQRDSLKKKLGDELTSRAGSSKGLDAESRKQTVSAVLGAEEAAQLESDIAREQAEKVARELDDETFSLSRKLQLTAEQEEHLRTALSLTQEVLQSDQKQLNEKMSNAMAQHFDGDSERTQLREAYQEIKSLSEQIKTKKYSSLAEQLNGVLSEQQITALLTEASVAPGN